jgi:hypothetical protein
VLFHAVITASPRLGRAASDIVMKEDCVYWGIPRLY